VQYRELLDKHPEMLGNRFNLIFRRGSEDEAVAQFRRHGVIQLRHALPPILLADMREKCMRAAAAFEPSSRAAEGYRSGKGNYPWEFQLDGYVLAPLFRAAIESWAWKVIEKICGSRRIVFFVPQCMARHAVDVAMDIGAHQDAVNVSVHMPFSVWVPLQAINPGQMSSLGFIVNGEQQILDLSRFPEHMLAHAEFLWLPAYELGDLTIHDNLTPHSTTGFGTGSERLSVELRCTSRQAALMTKHAHYHLAVRPWWGRRRLDMCCPAGLFDDVRPFLTEAVAA